MADEIKRVEIKKSHHHIISPSASMNVFLFLLVFTVITVAVARMDFGAANFIIAMLIATAKAMAVMLYFMALKYESNENRVIFFSGYGFLLLFLGFVITDYFARDRDMRVDGRPILQAASMQGALQFERPWENSEEIFEHGRVLYNNQACFTCHGHTGLGDGIAAGNLGPKNFTEQDGWQMGATVSGIYNTLTRGLGAMPAYSTLSIEDRLALAHYVRGFMDEPPETSAEDFEEIGIDVELEDGGLGGEESRSIPIDFALERYITK